MCVFASASVLRQTCAQGVITAKFRQAHIDPDSDTSKAGASSSLNGAMFGLPTSGPKYTCVAKVACLLRVCACATAGHQRAMAREQQWTQFDVSGTIRFVI